MSKLPTCATPYSDEIICYSISPVLSQKSKNDLPTQLNCRLCFSSEYDQIIIML